MSAVNPFETTPRDLGFSIGLQVLGAAATPSSEINVSADVILDDPAVRLAMKGRSEYDSRFTTIYPGSNPEFAMGIVEALRSKRSNS